MGKRVMFVAVVSALLLAVPAAPQMMSDGNVVKVYFVKAKWGMEKQWEEAFKKHIAFHKAQGDKWTWIAWQAITGPGYGTYGVGTFGHNWEDFDTPSINPEADEADYRASVLQFTESVTPSFWLLLKDVSHPTETEVPMSEVLTFELHYGKVPEFNYLIKKFTDAIVKTQWAVNYEWYALVNGGEMPTYVLVIPHANYASFKQPAKPFPVMLEEAYGRQEAEALLERLNKCVKEEQSELIRERSDLGYTPAMPK